MSEQQEGQPRRRRSRAEVERLVAEYEASGVSRAEFCRMHALALSTLHRYCRRRQPGGGQGAAAAQWVAVELSDTARGASGLVLLLAGGRRIEIARGFDAKTLAQLLVVLEQA